MLLSFFKCHLEAKQSNLTASIRGEELIGIAGPLRSSDDLEQLPYVLMHYADLLIWLNGSQLLSTLLTRKLLPLEGQGQLF